MFPELGNQRSTVAIRSRTTLTLELFLFFYVSSQWGLRLSLHESSRHQVG